MYIFITLDYLDSSDIKSLTVNKLIGLSTNSSNLRRQLNYLRPDTNDGYFNYTKYGRSSQGYLIDKDELDDELMQIEITLAVVICGTPQSCVFQINMVHFEKHDEYYLDHKFNEESILNCRLLSIYTDLKTWEKYQNSYQFSLHNERLPLLIGHRGLGKDDNEIVLENTIDGFNKCYDLGVEFCELDVLPTKDEVLVVYHDFFLGGHESIEKDEIRKLTTDQIHLKVNKSTRPLDLQKPQLLPRFRDLLRQVNTNLGLFVELKFPQALEDGCRENKVKSDDTREYYFQKNKFVDMVLNEIMETLNAKMQRRIVLISFDADLCILIRLKQPIFPVLQITRGAVPIHNPKDETHVDLRISSFKGAIEWAKFCNLQGVITRFNTVPTEHYLELKESQKYDRTKKLVFCYGEIPQHSNTFTEARRLGISGFIMDNIPYFVEKFM